MIAQLKLDRYADVLLWGLKTARNGKTGKRDIVMVRFDLPAVKLAETVHKKLIESGRFAIMRPISTPVIENQFYTLSDSRQLIFTEPGEKELYASLNGLIVIRAPESLLHLKDVDPKRIARVLAAKKPFRDILDKREEQAAFSWTLCMYPTEELARHADMTSKSYAAQIEKACFLDSAEPVKQWQNVLCRAGAVKKWLNSLDVKSFHIESDKVDLVINRGEKRKWVGVSGHNIPSFEIFLSPDWRGAKGRYYADQPSFRSGNRVQGICLEFSAGRVVSSLADEGGEFLKQQISMDGGSDRIGEFSLTDRRFSKIDKFMANTLFDENFGGRQGNCHIALGASYTDTYDGDVSLLDKRMKKKLGFNDSALHWDLVNTEKKRVTGNLKGGKRIIIYENGAFTL